MSHFKAFIYHTGKRTPLGRSMLRDPIQAFFFVMRGNFIYREDWLSNLYKKYSKWKWKVRNK